MNGPDGNAPWFVEDPEPKPALTRAQIVDAAHRLLHVEGIESLGVRSLARELGIATSQLHRRIGRKQHLLLAVADLVLSDIPIDPDDPATNGWRPALRAFSLDIRRTLQAHPHVHPVIDTHLLVTPAAVRLAEHGLAILSTAPFRNTSLVDAYNAWAGFVFGFSVIETQPLQRAEEFEDFKRWAGTYLDRLDRDRYPTVVANLGALRNVAFGLRWEPGPLGPNGTSYEIGLDALLSGLEHRLVNIS